MNPAGSFVVPAKTEKVIGIPANHLFVMTITAHFRI
jgi:hypothetical protein